MLMILAFAVGFSGNKTAEDKSTETAKQKSKLIIGLDDPFSPRSSRDDANKIIGFDIDMANEIGKRMVMEMVLQPIGWKAKFNDPASFAVL